MNVPEMFGSMVFNDNVMREMLPKKVYQSLQETMVEGKALDADVADIVASAMKEWAVGKGATHFTHWFQPMTGITAEKHDSFLTVDKNGCVIMNFSGKERTEGDVRGQGIHGLGSDQLRLHQGRHALHPDGLLFIYGADPGQEDALAQKHGCDKRAGREGSFPFRPERQAGHCAGSEIDRPHPSWGSCSQGAGDGGPLLRLDKAEG